MADPQQDVDIHRALRRAASSTHSPTEEPRAATMAPAVAVSGAPGGSTPIALRRMFAALCLALGHLGRKHGPDEVACRVRLGRTCRAGEDEFPALEARWLRKCIEDHEDETGAIIERQCEQDRLDADEGLRLMASSDDE